MPNAIASSSGFNGHVLDVPRDSEGDSDHEAVTKSRQIENGHARSEDGDNDDDNNKDGWTVETFKDQPLGKSNSTIHMVSRGCHGDTHRRQLKTLTDKLKEVIKKTEDGMVKTTDNARAMEDASPDDGVSTVCGGNHELRRPAERSSKSSSSKRDFSERLNCARLCRSRSTCWMRCKCACEKANHW